MKVARTAIAALVCSFALMLAPVALASSPATSAYGGACSTASLCNSSSLPFTGINVLEVAAMGLVLVGAGFVVRRSRRPGSH